MVNRFSVVPLDKITRTLALVAMGRQAPDLVITGARILSTYSDRIRENCEIWITGGRIAAVKPSGSYPLLPDDRTIRYDARDGIIAPGLIDPHVHIESSMMTACAYAESALLNGTTTIFCDCHDFANVCDQRGVDWFMADARRAPLNIFATLPSTVPDTSPVFETAGGDLTPAKIAGMFDDWPEAVGLGEKMDFVQVAAGDPRSHAILAEALRRGKPVSGHIYGRDFVAANAASGITDTHEAIDGDMADDCLEAGLWVFLRGGPPGSPWHSLPEAVKTLTEHGASPKRICLCTDDRDAQDLCLFGLDWVARQAVAAGVAPTTAWSMGSLHPATRYNMDGEIGGLGHSRRADLVLLNDDMEVQNTWYGGQLMVENKKITAILDKAISKRYHYPRAAYHLLKVPRGIKLTPPTPAAVAKTNIMRLKPGSIVVEHHQLSLRPARSWDEQLATHDLCFLTVVERHGKTKTVGHGLLQGFGLKDGAVGSSVGHDAHNIILAGTNERDMKLALATIKESKGGVCVVQKGKVLAIIELPIAGLMSEHRAPDVAKETVVLKQAWSALGCTLPFMGFSLLSLSVVPEIRLTDRGLLLVPEMKIVPLFEPAI